MSRFAQPKLRGSLWGRGRIGLMAGAVILVLLIVRYPAIRWFFAISVMIGLVMFGIIRWYNSRVPIKSPDEDKIVLHLNDDDDTNSPKAP